MLSFRKQYQEDMKDPRWLRTAARVIARDGKCRNCGSTQHLQAHHKFYLNLNAWQYRDEDMVTLCDPCHEWQTARQQDIAKLMFLLRKMLCLTQLDQQGQPILDPKDPRALAPFLHDTIIDRQQRRSEP